TSCLSFIDDSPNGTQVPLTRQSRRPNRIVLGCSRRTMPRTTTTGRTLTYASLLRRSSLALERVLYLEREAVFFRAPDTRYSIDLDALLAADHERAPQRSPLSFVFMTDFCGSTLLANALGALRGTRVLIEPRLFAELAVDKRRIDFRGARDVC